MALMGFGFLNDYFRVAHLFQADFFISSALVEGCGCGVVFISCRLGHGVIFSDAADSHQSIDGTYVSTRCWSSYLNVNTLSGLGFELPPVLFPVCAFALRFLSTASIASTSFFSCCCSSLVNFLGNLVFTYSRNFSCCGAFGCSMSKKLKHGPALLAIL